MPNQKVFINFFFFLLIIGYFFHLIYRLVKFTINLRENNKF